MIKSHTSLFLVLILGMLSISTSNHAQNKKTLIKSDRSESERKQKCSKSDDEVATTGKPLCWEVLGQDAAERKTLEDKIKEAGIEATNNYNKALKQYQRTGETTDKINVDAAYERTVRTDKLYQAVQDARIQAERNYRAEYLNQKGTYTLVPSSMNKKRK